MKIYINDIPVRIRGNQHQSNKKFDVVLDSDTDDIQAIKLKGKVLIKEKSHEAINRLLHIMTDTKYSKIKQIEIRVKNKIKAQEYLKSKFNIVEAAGGIVEKDDKILLILRHDLWDIPKGKLEKKEKRREGAIREVEEETGVKVKSEEFICSTWHTYIRNKKYVLKKTTWYRMSCLDDSKMKPQKAENIQKTVWMNANEVDVAVLHSYKTIKRVVNKYRDLLDELGELKYQSL
ncbi:MAG: NUDIX domain-containing protein [Reichenbachiella sp.]|uniref:NUDIX hydrolase n=1 Tax=Reichenbachiella sp. TaxID=2184521 RepID=UPI0032657280